MNRRRRLHDHRRLILAGHPDWEVAIDGRLYLYSRQDWLNYSDAALGRLTLSDIMAKYRPDAFFLHPDFHTKLIAELREAGVSTKIYQDEQCSLYLPPSSNAAKRPQNSEGR